MQKQDGTVENDKVYSKHLKWLPNGSEFPTETGTMFGQQQPASMDAKPVDGDILIAKLRPGQVIELEAHAVRGIGADHAKFSPVGTAWHRLYPEVVILQVLLQASPCIFLHGSLALSCLSTVRIQKTNADACIMH